MNKEQTEGVVFTETPETNPRDARRNSTGKVPTSPLSPSTSEGNILPRYLTTSTRSCHDFCKYGRKHTFESKARSPTFPRCFGSRTFSEKGKNQVKIPSLAEKEKNSAVKQKAAAHSDIRLYDRPKISGEKVFSPMKTVKSTQEFEFNMQNSICHERSGSSEESEIKFNFPSPSKEVEPLEGFGTIRQGALEKVGLCDDTETTAHKVPAFRKKTEASRDSETANKRKPSAGKIHLSPELASVEQRTQSVKKSTSAKPKIEQQAPSPVKKAILPGKPKVSKQMAPSPANRFDASARPSLSGESNISFLKSESQLKPATRIAGRNGGSKIVKNVNLSKPGGKKTLKSPSDSLLPQPADNHLLKSASPVKHAEKVGNAKLKNDKVREKTLYIIEPGPTENENNESAQSNSSSCQPSPSSPSSSLSSSSPSSSSSCVSDHEEEEHHDSESAFSEACDLVSDHGGDIAAQNEDKGGQRRVAIVNSVYEDRTPYKLKFRRGKILNPQSVSDHEEEEHHDSEPAFSKACDLVSDLGGDLAAQNEDKGGQIRVTIVNSEYEDQTPYKLKFRRGKILNAQSDHSVTGRLRFRQGKRMGDSQSGKGEIGMISFQTKELTCGDSSNPDPEAQALSLRHQDVQDKKDTPGLLNHVIEETASKLVETRKSKVKALVSAFETVISLQESKPVTSV